MFIDAYRLPVNHGTSKLRKITKVFNLSEDKIEINLSEVEFFFKKPHILLSSISSGVTRTGKSKTKKEVRDAVNVVSFDPRTMPGVKRKWFDINI